MRVKDLTKFKILKALLAVFIVIASFGTMLYAGGTVSYAAETNYLTFTAQEDNSSISFSWVTVDNLKASSDIDSTVSSAFNVSVEYSLNSTNAFQTYTAGTTITLNEGQYVCFKGKDVFTSCGSETHSFVMTGKFAASGDVTSLTNGSGGNATLYYGNYAHMFEGCTSLTAAPNLPSLNLAEKCYYQMFKGCTGLTTLPELKAETVYSGCYNEMFSGCSGIYLYEAAIEVSEDWKYIVHKNPNNVIFDENMFENVVTAAGVTSKQAVNGGFYTYHPYSDWISDSQYHWHQATCGHSNVDVKDKSSHIWSEVVVTKAATCKEKGVMTYTCSVCGTTKTEDIAKLNTHTWDAGLVTKPATCIEEGIKTYTCTVCGTTTTESIEKSDTHTWDGGRVTKPATTSQEGVMTYTCTACGTTKTESIAILESAPKPAQDDTAVYLNDLASSIETAAASSKKIVTFKDITTLSYDTLKVLNANPSVTLVMNYSYEGKDYHIVIPGDKVVLVKQIPWYGPLCLASIYGRYTDSSITGDSESNVNGITETYMIKQGDTLNKISKAYGISVDKLVALNQIKNPNFIYAGKVLKLRQ